jgi:murein DD-endopeptidase MepM/ murein hydrolase activator NlpD
MNSSFNPKGIAWSKRLARIASLWMICLVLVAAILGCQLGGQAGESALTPTQAVQAPEASSTEEVESATLPTQPPSSPSPLPPTEPPPTEAAAPPAEQPSEAPAEAAPCAQEVCIEDGTFYLNRPVGAGGRNITDPSNRFGEYQRSTRGANLGVGFLNSTGTPVVAAAAGKVIAAGDDSQTTYGGRPNTYGNLVILEHSLPGISKPVYTLYAHLSELMVEEGDAVDAGQEIGKVGMSGNVSGSTLDFEVRLGENTPEAARNPELWLEPLSDEEGQPLGALAGRLVDAEGEFIDMRNIVLERLGGPGQPALDQYYLKTYSDKDMLGQPPWGENFAVSGLPAGEYQISVWLNGMYTLLVDVEPGKLTTVTFEIQ